MTSAISCPLWSSVYECQRVECAFTSPVRTECGMFVMYCMQCCMSVSAVSRRYIDVCYCDMFSVVNVYLDHLKFYVVCINSRRYVCYIECDVVSNECNERFISCLVQPIGAHFNGISFSSSKQLVTKFNQQFNTSKLGSHTSSRETQLVIRETKRKPLEMEQRFTTDLVMRAIKSCRNSNGFGLDKLSIFHLKHLGPRAIEYITALFKLSVTTCQM